MNALIITVPILIMAVLLIYTYAWHMDRINYRHIEQVISGQAQPDELYDWLMDEQRFHSYARHLKRQNEIKLNLSGTVVTPRGELIKLTHDPKVRNRP